MTYSIMNWAFHYTNQPLQEPILHQNTIAIDKLYGNHVKIFETEPQIKCCLFCFTGQKPNNFGFQPNIHQNILVLICLNIVLRESNVEKLDQTCKIWHYLEFIRSFFFHRKLVFGELRFTYTMNCQTILKRIQNYAKRLNFMSIFMENISILTCRKPTDAARFTIEHEHTIIPQLYKN